MCSTWVSKSRGREGALSPNSAPMCASKSHGHGLSAIHLGFILSCSMGMNSCIQVPVKIML